MVEISEVLVVQVILKEISVSLQVTRQPAHIIVLQVIVSETPIGNRMNL
jgi:predicted transcriptional regulator